MPTGNVINKLKNLFSDRVIAVQVAPVHMDVAFLEMCRWLDCVVILTHISKLRRFNAEIGKRVFQLKCSTKRDDQHFVIRIDVFP